MRSTVFAVCSILLVLIQQNSLHALEIVASDNDTNGIGKEKKDPNPSPESPQNSSENAAATLDKWANVEPIDTPALSFKTNLEGGGDSNSNSDNDDITGNNDSIY
ncbi:uncharacterized protein LOC103522024 [Diaphorina citri]|uniref:Uncharacterized protein LOC103522024 n=1 Tax=Diaphorina citri TaxID=121845 RepID=A0A1S3DP39_DIACI|nr:uncharacterized protein LOC103522024 [Diaphorina citri]